jgi:hypothetical protein
LFHAAKLIIILLILCFIWRYFCLFWIYKAKMIKNEVKLNIDNSRFCLIFADKIKQRKDEKRNCDAVGSLFGQQLRTKTGAQREGSRESEDAGGVARYGG